MKIIKKEGDIFTSKDGIIVHACNKQGVMGAGIAKSIKENYFNAYEEYAQFIILKQEHKEDPMGCCVLVPVMTEKFPKREIANLICGTLLSGINYKAFADSLFDLKNRLSNHESYVLSIPDLIGAGLFGGDREAIHTIIEKVFEDTDCTIEYWIYKK